MDVVLRVSLPILVIRVPHFVPVNQHRKAWTDGHILMLFIVVNSMCVYSLIVYMWWVFLTFYHLHSWKQQRKGRKDCYRRLLICRGGNCDFSLEASKNPFGINIIYIINFGSSCCIAGSCSQRKNWQGRRQKFLRFLYNASFISKG